MPLIELTFFNGATVAIESDDLIFFAYGGQGRLFKYTYRDRLFLLKALLNDDAVVNRLVAFYRAMCGVRRNMIPDPIWYRAMPFAYAQCNGRVLGFNSSGTAHCLIYNFLNGVTLFERLSKHDESRVLPTRVIPEFDERKRLAKMVLEIFVFLENKRIVYNDIKPENMMIQKENQNVYLIDLEGAGLWDRISSTWIIEPMTEFEGNGWPVPPDNTPSLYTDRWKGMNLVWWILTGMEHPFLFMNRVDKTGLDALVTNLADKARTWPPNTKQTFQYQRPEYIVTEFKDFLGEHFEEGFSVMLYKTFIEGYREPECRTTFREMNEAFEWIIK